MKTKFTEFSWLHSQGFQWLQGFANLYEQTNTHKYVLLYREGNAQCEFKQLSKCVITDYEHTYIHKCLQLRTHHTHSFYGRHTYSMYKHGAIFAQSVYISTVHIYIHTYTGITNFLMCTLCTHEKEKPLCSDQIRTDTHTDNCTNVLYAACIPVHVTLSSCREYPGMHPHVKEPNVLVQVWEQLLLPD